MDPDPPNNYRVDVSDLENLFNKLSQKGYGNVGPIFRDGAIMMDHLESFNELPSGFYETLAKGSYGLQNKEDGSLFQYTVGPQSFKKFLQPERRKLWQADRNAKWFEVKSETQEQKLALWGIHSCELDALKTLDEVFINGSFRNEYYAQVRENLFIIAVGCSNPSANCFCTTMNGGPKPDDNFDISLVEVLGEVPFFLLTSATEKANELVSDLDFAKATAEEVSRADEILKKAEDCMEVRFDPQEVSRVLRNSPDDPHWEEVAQKCLSCANCTMVCPTCFCTTTEDITDITGDHTERWLKWDSCFNGDFSYIHGGQVRNSTKSRYRQWLTHKMSNWYDQFGSAGCVGCGRCTTWCPVGIDLTEELKAINKNGKVDVSGVH